MGDFLCHWILLWFYMAICDHGLQGCTSSFWSRWFRRIFGTRVTRCLYYEQPCCSVQGRVLTGKQNTTKKHCCAIRCIYIIYTYNMCAELVCCGKEKAVNFPTTKHGRLSVPFVGPSKSSTVIGRFLNCHGSMKINQRSRYWEDTI